MEMNLKLQEKYYNFILNGTKRIEIRLYDEKRRLLNIGDTICFLKEPELTESFKAKVIALLRYNSSDELMKDFDILILADKKITKDALKKDIEEFYTKDKQKEYGILGIKIELI